MIVSKSTHDAIANGLRAQRDQAIEMYLDLVAQHNELIARINEKGGEAFLDGDLTNNPFGKDEIQSLLQLCHPDKHNGKESAVRMTQKLLEVRETL